MKTKRFFPKNDQSGETLVEAVIALAVLSLFFTMFALALRSVKIWQRRADELYARETAQLAQLYGAEGADTVDSGKISLSFTNPDGSLAFTVPNIILQQVLLQDGEDSYTVRRYALPEQREAGS